MGIEALLREEIRNEIEELKSMEMGTDQYVKSVDGVAKLTDRLIEFERLDVERNDKEDSRQSETNLKLLAMEGEEKDRFIKNCIAVAGIVLPSLITVWGTVKSIEFEKEGTITTIMGRGFIQKLLPKK